MTVADTISRRRFFSFTCPASPGRLPLTNKKETEYNDTNYPNYIHYIHVF